MVELLLAVSGLIFTLIGGDDDPSEATFLGCWNLIAIIYLIVGGTRVRRLRIGEPERERLDDLPPAAAALRGRRLSFLVPMSASVTGLGAALAVLSDHDSGELGNLVKSLGVVAAVCAWLLLHVGYAQFYSAWVDRSGPGFEFPRTATPGIVDYLYFAVTVGVSFAASDVNVISRELRWYVMVHSVISFFYNAVVLAIAVGVLTSR